MLSQEQQIFSQIKKAKRILITFNKIWTGDAVASALALFLLLKKMDKDARIISEKFENSEAYSFLPAYKDIHHHLDNLRKFIISLNIKNAEVGQIKYTLDENSLDFIVMPKRGFFTPEDISSKSGGFKYDLIIAVDTPDLESLGSIYDNDTDFFYQTPIINIDHHADNEGYGQINCVNLTAVSTTEIIYTLFRVDHKHLIDEDIATCLLAGIISKTRSYKTQNITPNALNISAKLVALGGRREEIVNKLYRSRSLHVLKLWGRVLARLNSSLDDKLVWSTLSADDFKKTGTHPSDLSEVVDELIINIPEVKIIVIFYEIFKDDKQITQALIHSVKNINSLQLVKKYNPTGNRGLAKIKLPLNLAEAEADVIGEITNHLNKIQI